MSLDNCSQTWINNLTQDAYDKLRELLEGYIDSDSSQQEASKQKIDEERSKLSTKIAEATAELNKVADIISELPVVGSCLQLDSLRSTLNTRSSELQSNIDGWNSKLSVFDGKSQEFGQEIQRQVDRKDISEELKFW